MFLFMLKDLSLKLIQKTSLDYVSAEMRSKVKPVAVQCAAVL